MSGWERFDITLFNAMRYEIPTFPTFPPELNSVSLSLSRVRVVARVYGR